jgi:intracellular sulfur oxidation DsrE/DsrF family protein
MRMERRSILAAAIASAAGLLAARGVAAAEPATTKVVYHLADLDKVPFVLGNIENHFAGVGGPDKVAIALVVHGPALKAFHLAETNPDMTLRVGTLSKSGLSLHACGNTMRAQKVGLAQLLPGFVVADRGGVVRLVELQQKGYFYLRP